MVQISGPHRKPYHSDRHASFLISCLRRLNTCISAHQRTQDSSLEERKCSTTYVQGICMHGNGVATCCMFEYIGTDILHVRARTDEQTHGRAGAQICGRHCTCLRKYLHVTHTCTAPLASLSPLPHLCPAPSTPLPHPPHPSTRMHSGHPNILLAMDTRQLHFMMFGGDAWSVRVTHLQLQKSEREKPHS